MDESFVVEFNHENGEESFVVEEILGVDRRECHEDKDQNRDEFHVTMFDVILLSCFCGDKILLRSKVTSRLVSLVLIHCKILEENQFNSENGQ